VAPDDDLARALEEFNAEYRASLPQRMSDIDAAWSSVKRGENGAAGLHALLRALHSIAGSAPTFGMSALGEVAAVAETWIEPYYKRGEAPPSSVHGEFEPLLDAVKRAAA
jgi:chemotaxis protein histidine kinase CheA